MSALHLIENEPYPHTDQPTANRPRMLWGAVAPPAKPAEADPEPFEWGPRPTFRERAMRAVAAPAAIGIVLFLAAVITAIAMVALRPHAPAFPGDRSSQTEAPLSAGAGVDTPLTGEQGAAFAPGTAGSSDAERAAGAGSAHDRIFVHVVGQVENPGVFELQLGARVHELIDRAGGPSDEAALTGVNLARVLVDGEQVVVPSVSELEAAGGLVWPVGVGGTGIPGDDAASAVLNINTADAVALESLPRVGPALAQRIVEWRNVNGNFANVDDLLSVSGIGIRTLDGFRDRVSV